jgi:hypothetical protein
MGSKYMIAIEYYNCTYTQSRVLQNFRKLNKIGCPMMCEDPFNLDIAELIKAIDKDVKMSSMFAL